MEIVHVFYPTPPLLSLQIEIKNLLKIANVAVTDVVSTALTTEVLILY